MWTKFLRPFFVTPRGTPVRRERTQNEVIV